MGIFDVFTGDAYKQAGEQQRQYYDQLTGQVRGDVAGATKQGLDLLQGGQTGALGQIGTGFDTARGDIQGSLNPQLRALYGGSGQAAGALYGSQGGALDALAAGVAGAKGAYDPLAQLGQQYAGYGQQAADMAANAMGLGGQAGYDAARSAFQTGPGYQFQMEQGLEGLNRNANAAGGALGGNALLEAQKYGQGLANQEYGNWQDRLYQREGLYNPLAAQVTGQVAQGRAGADLTGGTGAANIITGTGQRLSDLYAGTGKAGADIYGRTGQTLADLAAKGGLAGADVYTGTAGRGAGLVGDLTKAQIGLQGSLADQYGKSWQQQAEAETGGSRNLWNLIGGGAKLFAGL